MKSLLNRVWREDEGVLTFEWILLITILVIGMTGALGAVRDALLTELGDIAYAIVAVDQSYSVNNPWSVGVGIGMVNDGGVGFSFEDHYNIHEERSGLGIETQLQTSVPTPFAGMLGNTPLVEPN